MITQTDVTVREVITPTTPTERQVFTRVAVGPEGARLQLRILVASIPPALAITTSAQAAVLEEMGRMLRIRLVARDRELARVAEALGVKVKPLLTAARARLVAKETAQDTPRPTPGIVGETCEPCDCDDEEACEAGRKTRARKAKPAGKSARKKRARR